MVDWMDGWLDGRFYEWIVSQLVGWIVGQMVDWIIYRIVCIFGTGRLVDQLLEDKLFVW